eukprot:COSAG06_NODE_1821_length_8290_cov_33.022586_2_plen_100_part_00
MIVQHCAAMLLRKHDMGLLDCGDHSTSEDEDMTDASQAEAVIHRFKTAAEQLTYEFAHIEKRRSDSPEQQSSRRKSGSPDPLAEISEDELRCEAASTQR